MSCRDMVTHREVEAMGFVLVRQKKHMIFKHPCGVVLTVAKSARCYRAHKNTITTAKRLLAQAGVPLCPATH